jgi:hypothetical protein
MQKWAESGGLDIRVPVKEDEERMDSILRDYRDWLNLHQGGDVAFLKTLKDAIPYFDETSTSRIRSDIRKKAEGPRSDKEPAIEKNDVLLQARLFLLAAQELDVQNFSIIREIRQFEEMEQDLFTLAQLAQPLALGRGHVGAVDQQAARGRLFDQGDQARQGRRWKMMIHFQDCISPAAGLFLNI